jgi:uncharacterized protein YciI
MVRFLPESSMNIALKPLLALLLIVGSPAMAFASSPEQGKADPVAAKPATPHLFAVIYRQGPNWKAGQPMQKQALAEHAEYYRRAMEEGRVFAGGGLVAMNGGLAILRMSNLDEARAFLAADPALLNGTFIGEVHAWNPRFVAEGPLRP